MGLPVLQRMRRRHPRWVAWLLAALLLCQQLAVAAHFCSLPVLPTAQAEASSDCMQSMAGADTMAIDCAAHCADPAKHGQDGVALAVPPLLPAVAQPRALFAGRLPEGDATDDPAERLWRRQHAATVLLI